MRRIALALLAAIVVSALACALLPERYAFNAPVRHTIWGTGGVDAPEDESFGQRILVADGFRIRLHADGLPGVRFLAPLEGGALLASAPRRGTVWLLSPDADGDGRSDAARPLLEGLERPHGLDVHDGWLYVGEGNAVGRVRIDATSGALRGSYERIIDGLPEGGNHWTRTVRIGPDGYLYVSVGSSCNVCFEEDDRRAAMLRFRADGSDGQIYATGLRNSVGFDWQPGTDALYATDNGRDLLGDDFPPCELNRVEQGGFYGWPVANGNRVIDPDFGDGHEDLVAASIPPAHGFAAHNAPLGITFLRHRIHEPDWRGAALVALHGSWNRTEKDGYKVVSLHWESDGTITERDFVWGFELDGEVIGRPVDVAEGPDGTIYVSDDYAGAIYRVEPGDAGNDVMPAPAERASSSEGAAPGRATRGAALWDDHACARCHDPAATEPGVVSVPLESLSSRYDPASLVEFLAAPTPPMPLFPLDDTERRDLAAYLLDTHE